MQMMHEQVKRLTPKEVEKHFKRYEAFVHIFHDKGCWDDVKACQSELKEDYPIKKELCSLSGNIAMRAGGPDLALVNAAFITTKHIVQQDAKTPANTEEKKVIAEEESVIAEEQQAISE